MKPHRHTVVQLWCRQLLDGLYKTQLETFLGHTNCLKVLGGGGGRGSNSYYNIR